MKQSAVPLLACPAPIGLSRCDGALALQAAPGLPLRTANEDSTEILEGALGCARCDASYPILSGVALLVPDPENYLRRYYDALRRDLSRHGNVSRDADRWLRQYTGRDAGRDDYGADFRFTQQFEAPWD